MNFGKIIDEAADNAARNTKINDNDYIKDGLLHCGNCHTAKQVRVNFLGVEKMPFCLCKCEQEKRDAELKELKYAQVQQTTELRRYKAFPDCQSRCTTGEDMKNWTFANDDLTNPKISNAAKKYVDNFETFREQGKGLLLYGTVGTGKSYIAACIANALIDKGYEVLMTNFARIEKTAHGMRDDKQEYFDSLNEYPLLILDDLAAERDTSYMQEIVFNVIDSRCRANLPLIITSNLTNEELKNPANISNQRIFSRVLKMCHPIKVEGIDRRKKAAVSDYVDMQKMLGL